MDDKKRARLQEMRKIIRSKKSEKEIKLVCRYCGGVQCLNINNKIPYTEEYIANYKCWRCKVNPQRINKLPEDQLKLKRAKKPIEKASRRTVAELMRETLGKDLTYPFDKLLKQVKAQFPEGRWDRNHYNWYRNKFRKESHV